MLVGFAEGHEQAAALKTPVILRRSSGGLFEAELRGFSDVFADVIGRMGGGFTFFAMDVVRVAGDGEPGFTKRTPGNPSGLSDDVKMRVPLIVFAATVGGGVGASRMESNLNDGIAGGNMTPPKSTLAELAEGLDETIELSGKGLIGMFERERVKLPPQTGAGIHEIENAGGRLGLDSATTDGTNPQLAGFGLEEQLPGFKIF